ncbi:MAG: hypothetical protein LV481_10215 [Methylacidiphilales bacterium]|nr:hypothetical protein [Candidatus Methylacidiphilales bacterium]
MRLAFISLPCMIVALITVAAGLLVLQGRAQTLYYGARPIPYRIARDSEAYIKIATGHLAEVESPFNKRILYPALAGTVSRACRLNLAVAFLTVNFLALALFAYCVAAFLEEAIGRPFLALVPLLSAYPFESLALAYLPDLFDAAFTALFFLLLLKNCRVSAMVVLLFLCLVRDGTLLLCVVTAGVAWNRRDMGLVWKSLVVLVFGLILNSALTTSGHSNSHHLWEPLYLVLKVLYNFMGNVFGLVFWTNLRPALGVPFVTWDVPSFLHKLGRDTQFGLALNGWQPVNTLMVLATLFGNGPLFLIMFWRKIRHFALPLPVQLALVYGLLSYFLGLALGNWVFRLVGYGWPAFWLALPYVLIKLDYRPDRRTALLLLASFWTLSWLWSLSWSGSHRLPVLPLAVPLLYAVTYLCLRDAKLRAPGETVGAGFG